MSDSTFARQSLAEHLRQIEANDTNYGRRYELVLRAMGLASTIGYRTGIQLDPAQPEWPVVYIDLPSGQVSWHMPQYPGTWDGHTTEQKYERCRAYDPAVPLVDEA